MKNKWDTPLKMAGLNSFVSTIVYNILYIIKNSFINTNGEIKLNTLVMETTKKILRRLPENLPDTLELGDSYEEINRFYKENVLNLSEESIATIGETIVHNIIARLDFFFN